ncbi:MAG: phage portal protein, partial [Caldilineaceae bacterium]
MKLWRNAKQLTTRIAARIVGGAVRRFAGAANSRLLADWIMACISPNDDIRQGLVPLRNRARDLEQNNSYVKRYLSILETEVVGSEGMAMQNRAVMYKKLPDGEMEAVPLKGANSLVEKEWAKWSKKGNCTVCGRFSFAQVQQKVLRWTARDGDMAIIIRRGAAYGPWGMQLQLLRGDYLDDTYTVPYRDGKRIDMGIERNADGRAVAYHFFTGDPNDTYAIKRERTRVPAEDVIYIANPQNPDEPRSVTWLHAIMVKLKMLDGGTEAELVAMRAEACKVFAWEDLNANANAGGDERKTNAPTNEQLSPGQSVYRPGKKLTSHSPAHPNGNFPGFYN